MKISYFGWLKETLDKGSECIENNDPVSTATLLELLSKKDDKYARVFSNRKAFCMALNNVLIEPGRDVQVMPEDELTFFPPMSGG